MLDCILCGRWKVVQNSQETSVGFLSVHNPPLSNIFSHSEQLSPSQMLESKTSYGFWEYSSIIHTNSHRPGSPAGPVSLFLHALTERLRVCLCTAWMQANIVTSLSNTLLSVPLSFSLSHTLHHRPRVGWPASTSLKSANKAQRNCWNASRHCSGLFG